MPQVIVDEQSLLKTCSSGGLFLLSMVRATPCFQPPLPDRWRRLGRLWVTRGERLGELQSHELSG